MRGKLLIIDDDEQILDLLGRIFEASYEVFTATDGRGGLELLKTEKPFLVFLDINLPGLSGMEVLVKIKELGVSTAVWMLSAEEDIGGAMSAMDKGASGYLTKPFLIDTISEIASDAFQNQGEKSAVP